MLRVAAAAAKAAGAAIELLQGSSSSIGPELGRFRAVTIRRAFHRMDRPRTLDRLDTLIEPCGAVVLFADSYPDAPANAWHESFCAVINVYARNDPARDVLATGKNHEAVLSISPFSHLGRIAVLEPRTTWIERFVDRVRSYARAWDGRTRSAWRRAGARRTGRASAIRHRWSHQRGHRGHGTDRPPPARGRLTAPGSANAPACRCRSSRCSSRL